jgi:hypothetical protein
MIAPWSICWTQRERQKPGCVGSAESVALLEIKRLEAAVAGLKRELAARDADRQARG